MKEKCGLVLILVATLALSAFQSLPFAASHVSSVVLSAFGTPSADEVVPGLDVLLHGSCKNDTFRSSIFSVCEMNDNVNNYYALFINDLTNDKDDLAAFFFDNENDGSITACGLGVEETLGLREDEVFLDGFVCLDETDHPLRIEIDTTFDGGGTVTFIESAGYVYQLRHPLNSGDPQDYAASPGDTLGFCLTYHDESGRADFDFPLGCILASYEGNAAAYGDIVIAESPTHTTATTPPCTITSGDLPLFGGIGVVAAAVAVAVGYAYVRRKRQVPQAEHPMMP